MCIGYNAWTKEIYVVTERMTTMMVQLPFFFQGTESFRKIRSIVLTRLCCCCFRLFFLCFIYSCISQHLTPHTLNGWPNGIDLITLINMISNCFCVYNKWVYFLHWVLYIVFFSLIELFEMFSFEIWNFSFCRFLFEIIKTWWRTFMNWWW